MNFYTLINGVEHGPHTQAEVEDLYRKGVITDDCMIRMDGSAYWVVYGNIEALKEATPIVQAVKPLPVKGIDAAYPDYQKQAKSMGVQSVQGLANIVTGLFAVFVIIMGATCIINLFLSQAIYYEEVERMEIIDGIRGFVGFGYFVVGLCGVITFCIWFYCAARNASALSRFMYPYSPGMSVGYFFIPFVNLVMPYKAMKAIFNTGENPEAPAYEKGTPMIRLWWAMFLLSAIFARASGGWKDEITRTSLKLEIISDLCDIVGAILVILLVQQISRKQENYLASTKNSIN